MLLLKTEYTLWGVNMINFSNLIYLPVDVPNPPKGAVEFFDTIDTILSCILLVLFL